MRASALLPLLTLLLVLGACAPEPAKTPAIAALDCAKPFEALQAEITARRDIVPAPEDRAQPYSFYSSADGKTSWLITRPGAPGHPAVMMQRAVGSDVRTTGCPYGDRAGYDQVLAYLESLKSWTRK